MSGGDTNSTMGFSFDNQPVAWAIIILLLLLMLFFFVGFVAPIFQIHRLRRRRRRRRRRWPRDRVLSPAGHLVYAQSQPPRRNNHWAWVTTRSQEGLNELGEAPPPYDGKKDCELRDLEVRASPPEYPAEPGPAMTPESRRRDE